MLQVVWLGRPITESSWEPASSLPSDIIEEYESGIQRDVQEKSYTSGGQTIYTLLSARESNSAAQPHTKKPRLDKSTIESSNSGWVPFWSNSHHELVGTEYTIGYS